MTWRRLLPILAGLAAAGPATAQPPATPEPPSLPPPYATPSVDRHPVTLGWPADRTPAAPPGFRVTRWAGELDYPRWLLPLANGDVLVAEARTRRTSGPKPAGQVASREAGQSADRITLLRDGDGDGDAETRHVLRAGLNQPFGMALLGNHLYVANTDAVLRFPYAPGQIVIESDGDRLLALPAGGYNNHWTRNLVASPDGKTLFVTVGSASDHGEHGMVHEARRAAILAIDPDGRGERMYASGLRNPNGLDFEPTTGAMWVAVNERDHLGDHLVPDYATRVQEGGFYGWPYAYFGRHLDPRVGEQRPELVAKALVPDLPLGSHTASLGLLFVRGTAFPPRHRGGMLIAQHGSWNSSTFVGYRVAFVPFANGAPAGPPEDFLTGFIADAAAKTVYGRPCGLAQLADGSLLVADDAGNTIWRVTPVR